MESDIASTPPAAKRKTRLQQPRVLLQCLHIYADHLIQVKDLDKGGSDRLKIVRKFNSIEAQEYSEAMDFLKRILILLQTHQ